MHDGRSRIKVGFPLSKSCVHVDAVVDVARGTLLGRDSRELGRINLCFYITRLEFIRQTTESQSEV